VRRPIAVKASLVTLALAFILLLADRRPPDLSVRWTTDARYVRYAVVGNSEANAILTHHRQAAHFWESRATMLDRQVQLELAFERFPGINTVLMNVMPAEMAIDPHCLTFRTPLSAGLENAHAMPRRSLASWRHARMTDFLANPHKLLAAIEDYITLDPRRMLRAPSAPFRQNGAKERHDPVVAPTDIVFDDYSTRAVERCAPSAAINGHLNVDAVAVIQTLGARAARAGARLVLVVTPMHPTYRRSLDEVLAVNLEGHDLSTEVLIKALHGLGFPVVDDSRLFDDDACAFLNGDHLSSHGEHLYGRLFLNTLRRACSDCA
jgi:hypothetical protein